MYSFELRNIISVDQSSDQVMAYLANLSNWQSWCPWLVIDSHLEYEHFGEKGELGDSLLWNSRLNHSGNISYISNDQHSLEFQYHSISPDAYFANLVFDVLPDGQHSIITLVMTIHLKWRHLLKLQSIKRNISLDMDRGLEMLKYTLEHATLPSQLQVCGLIPIEPIQYVGLRCRANTQDLFQTIAASFSKTQHYLSNRHQYDSNECFVLFEQFDFENKEFDCVTCVPIQQAYDVEPPFLMDTLKLDRALKIVHTGELSFSKNAWALSRIICENEQYKRLPHLIGLQWFDNVQDSKSESSILVPIR